MILRFIHAVGYINSSFLFIDANPLYPGIRDGKPSPSALAPEEWNRRVNLPQFLKRTINEH